MTQHSAFGKRRNAVIAVGVTLVAVALVALIALGIWISGRSNVFGPGVGTDAMLFIDVPGRIAIDGTLQVEGPAPVPVSNGEHSLTFFDSARSAPRTVTIDKDEFLYVPAPAAPRSYSSFAPNGFVHVSAFPPNTTIEIPDCTPVHAKYPVVCKGNHTLGAELSPGTYTIIYSSPQFGEYKENITIATDSVITRDHSFISTMLQWNEWLYQHGDIIEQQYPYYRSRRSGGAVLLPFEATGEFLDALFD